MRPAQLFAGLVLAALILPVTVTAVSASERPGHSMRRDIAVQGLGVVKARPDVAIIQAGVTAQAKTAKAALVEHNKVMAKLLAALKVYGLAKRDIQTRQINLHPIYPRRKGDTAPPTAPKPVAFRASGNVRIRLGEIDRVGDLLDQMTAVGVTNLSGLQFTIAKPEPLQDQARKLAVQDARRRAQLYAKEAGVELGPVIRIREGGAQAAPMREMRTMAMAAASPVAAGENEIRVSVSVVFAIK